MLQLLEASPPWRLSCFSNSYVVRGVMGVSVGAVEDSYLTEMSKEPATTLPERTIKLKRGPSRATFQ